MGNINDRSVSIDYIYSMENKLLQESFDLIKASTKLSSSDISLELIDYWRMEDPKDVDEENDDAWTIFLYAYLLYKKNQGLESFQVKTEELMQIFEDWQFIVNLAFVNKIGHFNIQPFPLLDFDNIQSLQFEMRVED